MSKYDEVLRPFLAMMETELHANAAKGDRPGWLSMTAEQCLLEIYYHVRRSLQPARGANNSLAALQHFRSFAHGLFLWIVVCFA